MNAEIKKKVWIASILFCMLMTVAFDVIPLDFFSSERRNELLDKSLSLVFGSIGVVLLLCKEKSGLFKKPTNLIWFIPALIMAIDNFQWASFYAGKMQLIPVEAWDWGLFTLYSLLTGFFEEGIFRGVLFALIADRCEKNKKGLLQTFIFSSLLFGGIHLLNVFAGGGLGSTVLQACYSVLTGGMFAFVLIKTKNIFFCAFTHGLYNFCGTLFSETGLGMGVVFDLPTALTMTVVSLFVAVFVFWGLKRYTEEERVELYSRLGFGVKPLESDSEETIEKAF